MMIPTHLNRLVANRVHGSIPALPDAIDIAYVFYRLINGYHITIDPIFRQRNDLGSIADFADVLLEATEDSNNG